MITRTGSFKCKDGKVYENWVDAEHHERFLMLKETFNDGTFTEPDLVYINDEFYNIINKLNVIKNDLLNNKDKI